MEKWEHVCYSPDRSEVDCGWLRSVSSNVTQRKVVDVLKQHDLQEASYPHFNGYALERRGKI